MLYELSSWKLEIQVLQASSLLSYLLPACCLSCNFYLSFIGIERSGGFYEHKPMYIEQMPIPMLSESLQEPFYKIVDEILSKKKKGIETNYLENKIDQMVYELFELTKDEVELMESL